jgi:uroporphyrinogen-III synthase
MPRPSTLLLPLQHFTVLSLRPRGQHAPLRHAAARHGARLIAVSTLAATPLNDTAHRRTLADALAADTLLFTSPNAVHAAATLIPFSPQQQQCWLAVGEGTRRVLQGYGIHAAAPARMDSEGLLALPELRDVAGKRIGLITAPGGRGMLQPALQARGATVIRAHVYQRQVIPLRRSAKQALDQALTNPQQCLLALSSDEALQALLAQVTHPRLFDVGVLAASERLAQCAHAAGFRRISTATSARPDALMQAALPFVH